MGKRGAGVVAFTVAAAAIIPMAMAQANDPATVPMVMTQANDPEWFWVCHRRGTGDFIRILVNQRAVPAHNGHGDPVAFNFPHEPPFPDPPPCP